VLGLDAFDEDDLYENLDWLAENQDDIEDKLYRSRYGAEKPELYLYDVTSSYFEGVCNALAAFGYCRDGKKGKCKSSTDCCAIFRAFRSPFRHF
jgi:hypothetical protein